MSDNVNHPAHYNNGKIEVIDYIEDKGFGFNLGNAIKYISRAGLKDKNKTVEDLEKAIFYINRQIALIKKKEETVKYVVNGLAHPWTPSRPKDKK